MPPRANRAEEVPHHESQGELEQGLIYFLIKEKDYTNNIYWHLLSISAPYVQPKVSLTPWTDVVTNSFEQNGK